MTMLERRATARRHCALPQSPPRAYGWISVYTIQTVMESTPIVPIDPLPGPDVLVSHYCSDTQSWGVMYLDFPGY